LNPGPADFESNALTTMHYTIIRKKFLVCTSHTIQILFERVVCTSCVCIYKDYVFIVCCSSIEPKLKMCVLMNLPDFSFTPWVVQNK